MGSDRDRQPRRLQVAISIHAPAWGATGSSRQRRERSNHFNPRSRMGSDENRILPATRRYVFQSTLPHGERPDLLAPESKETEISIHAPAWGATGRTGRLHPQMQDFNPRSRMGSDKIIQSSPC